MATISVVFAEGFEGDCCQLLKVDIRSVAVPVGTRVWRLFPGHDYKFLDHFANAGVGFLDLPALTFPEGALVSSDELLARILASQRTKELIRDFGDVGIAAFTNWDVYLDARRTSNRSRLEQAVINFYGVAKVGDYVIVPSSLSDRYVLIGRFTSNNVGNSAFRYGDHKLPSRSIKWMARIDEGKLSERLAKSLRHQHAFSLVERSRFIEILSIVNGNYQFDDMIVGTIFNRKDDFIDADSALVGVLSKLAAAACQSMEANTPGLAHDALRTIVTSIDKDFTCTQESDIHSAGFIRLISGAVTPLVVSCLLSGFLTVDLSIGADAVYAQLQNMAVENSTSPDDACVPKISEATKRILNSVGIEITYEMCKAAQEASERAGLDPTAKGEVAP